MPTRRTLTLIGVPLAVAAALRLWELERAGFGNQYYAATVKSMTTSLAAFLYGSFDPQLFVSVDKPAPGLWPQAITAIVFGFSSLALMLPQAVSGILSVAVLFAVVARSHGALAASLAALALAVAPVAVAVDRNNTMDAELVLVLLLAVWCALRALDGGARWLFLAGVLVGVGFEIKMSQAYVALPAIGLTYLVGAAARPLARLVHVAGFVGVTLAASLLWVVFVDLTPRDARPYVGSSTTNSALELATGHNGLARLPQELLFWRRGPGPAAGPPQGPRVAPQPSPPLPPPGGPAQGPVAEAGERGALRLFNEQLAGQVSWYIPIALIGGAALLARDGRRRRPTAAQASALLWLLWLLPTAVLFSWSGIFHRYYLVMLVPPLAALVGAGLPAAIALARLSVAWRVAIIGAAFATAALHATVVLRAGTFAPWLAVVAFAGAAAAMVALVPRAAIRRAAVAVAVASLFAAPVTWAATTLDAFDAGLPYAGPELFTGRGSARPSGPIAAGPPPRAPAPGSLLLDFLRAQHRGERWILATSSQGTASSLMLRGDVAVMAIGGFSGGDPILTPASLAAKVRMSEVRFVMIEDRMRQDLASWVRTQCVEVPPQRYGAPAGPAVPGGVVGGLFDCARVRGGP